MSSQRQESNGNWRGGKHVAPNGYVKVCLGEGHPDAGSDPSEWPEDLRVRELGWAT